MAKETICPKCHSNEIDVAGRCVSCGTQVRKKKKK